MPYQSRVDPFGNLFADRSRGLFMGNRGGRIHRDDGALGKRRWASRQWICCLLSFKGRLSYSMTRIFTLVSEVGRKAALDTNTLVGDEYLVGLSAMAGVEIRPHAASSFGLGLTDSSGRKTHKVQGQSYDYANRITTVEASATVRL